MTDEEQPAGATEERVVERYKRGDKIRSIAEEEAVPVATVYAILDRHGVTADRAKRRSRVVDNATLEDLMQLIQHQNARITELQQLVTVLTATVDENSQTIIDDLIAEIRTQNRALEWWRSNHPRTKEPETF